MNIHLFNAHLDTKLNKKKWFSKYNLLSVFFYIIKNSQKPIIISLNLVTISQIFLLSKDKHFSKLCFFIEPTGITALSI